MSPHDPTDPEKDDPGAIFGVPQEHIAIRCERVHAELSRLCDVFGLGQENSADPACPEFSRAEIAWATCLLRLLDTGAYWGFRTSAIGAMLSSAQSAAERVRPTKSARGA